MVIKTKKGYLDSYEGIKYPFNFSIGDVRDITKRNIDFSKTIKIPATKNNNDFFGNFYDVNVQSGSFNPNQKEFIVVEEEGEVVFEGFLQLLSVVINGDLIYYEAVVFSSFRNILDVIDGVNLDDLDFSEYNHVYDASSFQVSGIGQDSTDKDRYNNYYLKEGNEILRKMSLGYGYVYSYISYDGTIQEFDWLNPLEDYPNAYPAFFVREYIDKIFLLAGFKVESKFFDTDYFKSLILPFTNGKLTFNEEERLNFTTSYSQDSYSYPVVPESSFYATSISPVAVNSVKVSDVVPERYNTLTNELTIGKSNKYDYNFKGDFKLKFNDDTQLYNTLKSPDAEFSVSLMINGNQYEKKIINEVNVPVIFTSLPLVSGFREFDFSVNAVFSDVNLNKDDVVTFELNYSNEYYYERSVPILRLYLETHLEAFNTSFEIELSSSAEIELGDTLDVSKALPKIKITDFLKSIITMFNLYIHQKKDAENTLIIETRDEFYSNNKTHFMEDKIDKSKPIKISTLSEESAKTYLYKFKDGKDYITKEFKEDNDGETYGEKRVVTDNQFITKTQSYTSSFAPTGETEIVSDLGNLIKCPVIFDRELIEGSIDEYKDKRITSNPRMLFYQGDAFASSVDKADYPTYSLNFEDDSLFFDLYNLFHKNTIEEVSSPDAKLLSCYLMINMAEVDISDRIFLMGEYWRINKVVDYDANSNESTKVELFKLKGNVNYLTAETIIVEGEDNNTLFNNQFNNQYS